MNIKHIFIVFGLFFASMGQAAYQLNKPIPDHIQILNNAEKPVFVLRGKKPQAIDTNETIDIAVEQEDTMTSFSILVGKKLYKVSFPTPDWHQEVCDIPVVAHLDVNTIIWLANKNMHELDEVCLYNDTLSDITVTDLTDQSPIRYTIDANDTFFKNARYKKNDSAKKSKIGKLRLSDRHISCIVTYLMHGYNPKKDDNEWQSIKLNVETLFWFKQGFSVKAHAINPRKFI